MWVKDKEACIFWHCRGSQNRRQGACCDPKKSSTAKRPKKKKKKTTLSSFPFAWSQIPLFLEPGQNRNSSSTTSYRTRPFCFLSPSGTEPFFFLQNPPCPVFFCFFFAFAALLWTEAATRRATEGTESFFFFNLSPPITWLHRSVDPAPRLWAAVCYSTVSVFASYSGLDVSVLIFYLLTKAARFCFNFLSLDTFYRF